MTPKLTMKFFSVIAVILVLAGIVFGVFGLGILPVKKDVLLPWESAIYGAIMIGWGTTLLLVGALCRFVWNATTSFGQGVRERMSW